MTDADNTNCPCCGSLPDSDTAYLDRDQALEPASRNLNKIGDSFRRCPTCEALFFYQYWPPGPGNIGDFECLTRLEPHLLPIVRGLLTAGPETGSLGEILKPAQQLSHEDDWNIIEPALKWAINRVSLTNFTDGLVTLLSSSELRARHFASLQFVELATAGHDLSAARPALQAAIDADHSGIHMMAGKALAVFLVNTHAWADLRPLLTHHDAAVRHGAVDALQAATKAKADLSPVLDVFESLLNDPDPTVCITAADVLYYDSLWGTLNPVPVVVPLIRAMISSPKKIRSRVARTLGQLARKGADITGAFPHLIALLQSDDQDIQQQGAAALAGAARAGLNIRPAIESLARLLASDPFSYSNRNAAIMDALRAYGKSDPARPAEVYTALTTAGYTDGCSHVREFVAEMRNPAPGKSLTKKIRQPRRRSG